MNSNTKFWDIKLDHIVENQVLKLQEMNILLCKLPSQSSLYLIYICVTCRFATANKEYLHHNLRSTIPPSMMSIDIHP